MSESALTPDPQAAAVSQLPERRAFLRLTSDLAATCAAANERDVGWPGKIRDISQGGVGLLLRHRFRPGTRLTVELRSHSGAYLRTVRARVVHAKPAVVDGVVCWVLGCAFDQPLSEEELQPLL
jgi:hypothetical protein